MHNGNSIEVIQPVALENNNGTLTLEPKRWKWVIGAVFALFVIPGIGIILGGVLLAIAFGALQSIVLKPYGFEVRSWGATKAYRWDEVGSFTIHTHRYMFIPIHRQIIFTPVAKEGKLLTRAVKLFSGGTHRINANSMPAKKLADLMNVYRDNYITEMGGARAETEPVAPRVRHVSAPEKTYSPPVPMRMPRKDMQAPAKPIKTLNNNVKIHTSKAKKPIGQDPLVKDGFGRKWRTRD